MLEYANLRKDKRTFLALTGLTVKEFDALHEAFSKAYQQAHPADKTSEGKKRKRKAGGGCSGHLPTTQHKLLFILVYQKTYPIQALLGATFGMSQSRANRWIHALLPVLRDALDAMGVLPERDPKQFPTHERQQHDSRESRELIIDGTDRRRQRPKNKARQDVHYTGKRKAHSDKNVLIVDAKTKRVGYLSQTYPGKIHDKKIADHESIRYPRRVILHKDTGFQGYEPPRIETRQPQKNRAISN